MSQVVVPAIFSVPKARWVTEINALLAFHSWPTREQLQKMKKDRCYWCQQRFKGDVTREHVVRRSSAAFIHLRTPEKRLTLRLSHRQCHEAYAQWTQQHPDEAASQEGLLAEIAISKYHDALRKKRNP